MRLPDVIYLLLYFLYLFFNKKWFLYKSQVASEFILNTMPRRQQLPETGVRVSTNYVVPQTIFHNLQTYIDSDITRKQWCWWDSFHEQKQNWWGRGEAAKNQIEARQGRGRLLEAEANPKQGSQKTM